VTDVPRFFVPMATLDNDEEVYFELARWSSRPVPSFEKRIYSITFVHAGDEWTATVGEPLRGVRRRSKRSRGEQSEEPRRLTDPAIVQGIFPGLPGPPGTAFVVVTDYQLADSTSSAWANPFEAGRPTSITYFSSPRAGGRGG
jgi:hypothetical protein